jgi:hypothetical protein
MRRTSSSQQEQERAKEKLDPATPSPASPPDASGRRRFEDLRWCLGVFVGTRAALLLIGLVGVALLPDFSRVAANLRSQIPLVPTPVDVPGWPAHLLTPGWHNLFTAWERLDVLWFLRIASTGYSTHDASAAFFPLFPLVVKAVSFLLGGHPFAAGMLVSNGCFLGALVVLYRLTEEELSTTAARRAVVYASVFPTSLFFLAPYSEALFLLLVLVSFRAARRARWPVAAGAALLAALTRNVGVVMVLPLAGEALLQRRERGLPPISRDLVWAIAPVIGLLAYLGYWWGLSGDALAPLHQQANWQRALADPLTTLGKGTTVAFRYLGVYPGGYHTLDWFITAFVLIALVYATIKLRPTYSLFAWAMAIVPLTSLFASRPLIAYSRYALPIFPMYWAMAIWSEKHPVRHEVLVAASAMLLGLMALLFVNWYYVI